MGNCYTKLHVMKQENYYRDEAFNIFLDKYCEYLDVIDERKKNRILAMLLMHQKHIPIDLIYDYNKYILQV